MRQAVATVEAGTQQPDVAAVSVDAQAHGLVPVDASGAVFRPAKLWNDTTSVPEARELVGRLGAAEWARRAGSVPRAFADQQGVVAGAARPEAFSRLHTLLLPHDWLTYRLVGEYLTTLVTRRAPATTRPPRASGIQTYCLWLTTTLTGPTAPAAAESRRSAGTITTQTADELGLGPTPSSAQERPIIRLPHSAWGSAPEMWWCPWALPGSYTPAARSRCTTPAAGSTAMPNGCYAEAQRERIFDQYPYVTSPRPGVDPAPRA